jgi:hypothetical protein
MCYYVVAKIFVRRIAADACIYAQPLANLLRDHLALIGKRLARPDQTSIKPDATNTI